MERLSRVRITAIIVLIALVLGGFFLRLYKLQLAPGDSYIAEKSDSVTYQTIVEAARGNLLDRNGNVLIGNRASYNLIIINFVLFNSDAPNENLLHLLELCDELSIAYESTFPVTPETPYSYDLERLTQVELDYFRTFLRNRDYDLDISASTLIRNLRAAYRIPDDWTNEQAYHVISVRYELELRGIDGIGLENYTLAKDVSADALAAVMELGVPGVVVESTTVREYNTKLAAHILGTLRPMDAEQWEYYKELGYAMNALVGESGVEKAFEEYLHGKSGIKFTTVSSSGEVLEEYFTSVPEPGDNIELTLDISLQATAEQALEDVILDLRENGIGRRSGGKDAEGGAVVVQQVKTGEILAMASYPTYDIATFRENYAELAEDPYKPMFNRALAAFAPGSIYKMVSAITDIDYGGIGQYYTVTDQGVYNHYEGFSPVCHIWTSTGGTHGTINMREALRDSCNYYFYETGRLTYDAYHARTGENPFDIVAKALGLGEPTGIEIDESTGQRANAETKAAQYEDQEAGWYGADVLQAVIGQSLNRFTPLQMVCYTSALANKGVRYEATLLSRIVSWDYQDLILQHEPTVASTLEMSDEAIECYTTGMRMVATEGTAKDYLANYPIPVACKTGTVEWQGAAATGKESASNHASFVLYAPADDPEIAIAVYIEKGSQGGNLANVCIPILDAYFSTSSHYELAYKENSAN